MSKSYAIVWFRNDLRLADNPALNAAAKHHLIPIYIHDANVEHSLGGASKWWVHHALAALNKSLAGKLLWVTSQTRPDVSYDSCWVSNCGKNPTVRDVLDGNKAVRKLKLTTSELQFPNLGDPRQIEVIVFQDAAHA